MSIPGSYVFDSSLSTISSYKIALRTKTFVCNDHGRLKYSEQNIVRVRANGTFCTYSQPSRDI